jgi:hypothetical protein
MDDNSSKFQRESCLVSTSSQWHFRRHTQCAQRGKRDGCLVSWCFSALLHASERRHFLTLTGDIPCIIRGLEGNTAVPNRPRRLFFNHHRHPGAIPNSTGTKSTAAPCQSLLWRGRWRKARASSWTTAQRFVGGRRETAARALMPIEGECTGVAGFFAFACHKDFWRWSMRPPLLARCAGRRRTFLRAHYKRTTKHQGRYNEHVFHNAPFEGQCHFTVTSGMYPLNVSAYCQACCSMCRLKTREDYGATIRARNHTPPVMTAPKVPKDDRRRTVPSPNSRLAPTNTSIARDATATWPSSMPRLKPNKVTP